MYQCAQEKYCTAVVPGTDYCNKKLPTSSLYNLRTTTHGSNRGLHCFATQSVRVQQYIDRTMTDTYAIIFIASVGQRRILLVLTVLYTLKKLHLPVVPLSAIPLPWHSNPRETPICMLASQDKMPVVVGLYSWVWSSFVVVVGLFSWMSSSFVVHTLCTQAQVSDDCKAPATAQRGDKMETSS